MTVKEKDESKSKNIIIILLVIIVVILCAKIGWDRNDYYEAGYKAALEEHGIEYEH